jgi:uncharacterized protein (TIGR03492 family)
MRLLCLSNGHGEDAIACRILNALQQLPDAPSIEALPLVGEGYAYTKQGIPLIGTVKVMPSGGFIYMDGRQLARDVQGGLVQLTLKQWGAVKDWVGGTAEARRRGGEGFVLAVGDIVPLLFARLSGLPYGFVGTAKSEYYIRDEAGLLPRNSWWDDRLQRWTGCIYHPWERWLMRHPQCRAVFPRDSLTASNLRRFGIPAFDLGNPMMDGLDSPSLFPLTSPASPLSPTSLTSPPSPLTLLLLPGSRPPEAYANWELILQAVNGLIAQIDRPLVLLAAIAPSLDLEKLRQIMSAFRWREVAENSYTVGVGERGASLVLATDRFAEFAHQADLAIAMAGTATEQFVGLGKPAILIPGKGPQFTPAFAESYTRLLGISVIVAVPEGVSAAVQNLLKDPDRLQQIAANGRRRMGTPGAAERIAKHLLTTLTGEPLVALNSTPSVPG